MNYHFPTELGSPWKAFFATEIAWAEFEPIDMA
jgi:hypothetical protein